MNLKYESLYNGVQRLNAALFSHLGACVGSIRPDGDTVDLSVISRCGSARWDVPMECFVGASWEEKVLQRALGQSGLLEWIGDVSFGRFRKSDLYLALCSRIVMPTQVASAVSYTGNGKCSLGGEYGLDAEEPVFIITGIQHSVQGGVPRVEAIRGEIPAADEFHIWRNEVAALMDLSSRSLEDTLKEMRSRLAALGDQDLRVVLGENAWGRLFDPRTPTELWVMHRAMGSLFSGARVCIEA